MEILYIVDENDNVKGQAPKDIIYKEKYTHRIVHILVFNKKGQMALQLRTKNCLFCPNCWSTSVGGHVKAGETYEEAALREYKEELGVVSNLSFFKKDFYVSEGAPNKFLVTFKAYSKGPFNLNAQAVDKIEFFSIKKISSMIRNGQKFHPELLFLLKKYFLKDKN